MRTSRLLMRKMYNTQVAQALLPERFCMLSVQSARHYEDCKTRTAKSGCATQVHPPLLAGRRLGLINHLFLKIFHLRICAECFSHRRICQLIYFRRGESFRIGLWIIDRNSKLQFVMVQPAEAFDDVKRIAVRMTGLVERGLVVETDRIDYKSIALIPSNRIA